MKEVVSVSAQSTVRIDPSLRNDLLCVKWNVKLYTLTHSLMQGTAECTQWSMAYSTS